ncbi:hypothetical protein IWQ60_008570 [Tieghemiomyces parasiticus]|uniref:Saccharopine dehydrogenase (NAD(+), L-glutamate-forming) n=1 Tax=Tieghemiomyces parasiticus TaxID=78921 RepID=A0A9W7ZRG6_9FUNG|nr:hypothetical protein IWQ60_008570 [Tieghemiomyces parasiticus]
MLAHLNRATRRGPVLAARVEDLARWKPHSTVSSLAIAQRWLPRYHSTRAAAAAQRTFSVTRSVAKENKTVTHRRPSTAPRVIGIRREDKNRWERRVALIPDDVSKLIRETGVRVLVQPSNNRIFPNAAFEKAGATVQEDLSEADVILGIKEIPRDLLLPNKTYVLFSHTHKGQPYNQPTLQAVLDRHIRLIDYELITDPTTHRRTVLFGRQAGLAGAIDCLHGLGRRLLALGYHTPFLFTGMAHNYPGLTSARRALTEEIAHLITRDGLPADLGPLTFTVAGSGHVAKGALEILELLPHRFVTAAELGHLVSQKRVSHRHIYIVKLRPEDYLVAKDGAKFSKERYYAKPEEFVSQFHDKIAPYTSVLVNGLYWTEKQPRLLTKQQLRHLQSDPQYRYRMLAVADIGCDIEGPLEFMSHFSSIDEPFYYYDAVRDREHVNESEPGVQILGVENLPAELPLESSRFFSHSLMPLMPELIRGNYDHTILRNATIAADGQLLARHSHLAAGLKRLNTGTPPPAAATTTTSKPARVTSNEVRRVLLAGSGMVAKPLVEYLTRSGRFEVTVASNNTAEAASLAQQLPRTQSAPLDVADETKLAALVAQADAVVSLVPAPLHPRLARVCIAHGKPLVTASYISPEMRALDADARRAGVLILNEIGLDPGIDHLTAMQVIDEARHRGGRVTSFISWCGGLPAPEASGGGNPLGYKFSWSPRGVLTAGQNPARFKMNGRQHQVAGSRLMAARFPHIPLYPGFALEGLANRDSMQYVDTYGLGPAAGMRTMFRGTLRYQGYAELMHALTGIGLLNAEPSSAGRFDQWPEVLDHLLGGVDTAARTAAAGMSDATRMRHLAQKLHLSVTHPTVQRVHRALLWLGLWRHPTNLTLSSSHQTSPLPNPQFPTTLDGFSTLLQAKMQYAPGERDMSLLFHEFIVEFPDDDGQGGQPPRRERHTSSLVVYGTPNGDTSMAKTVGLPAAMATELILEGKLADMHGVHAPIYPQVYNPILARLAGEGIRVVESIEPNGVSMSETLAWNGGQL